MDIEIFPAEKSCEQGCYLCPLARKDRDISEKAIDPEVQKTFSFLEAILQRRNISYSLHFSSALNLFPKIRHPELIRMSRFETGKEVKLNGNALHFADSLKKLLAENRIEPEIVAFSFVPDYPVVSENDAEVISSLIGAIADWHFRKPSRSVDITVRSNLIKSELFDEVSGKLFKADSIYLRKAIARHGTLWPSERKAALEEGKFDRLYRNSYIAERGANKIVLSNRVITLKPPFEKDIVKFNVDQALTFHGLIRLIKDVAIAPKGVMLIHSSIWINNPVFWITHQDFKKSLMRALRSPYFSIRTFLQRLLRQNAVMYEVFMTKKDELGFCNIKDSDFMYLFEQARPHLKD